MKKVLRKSNAVEPQRFDRADEIEPVRAAHRHERAGARHRDARERRREARDIAADAAGEHVVAETAGQQVVAGGAREQVGAGVAGDGVGGGVAGTVEIAGAGQRERLQVGGERVADRGDDAVGAFIGLLVNHVGHVVDRVAIVAGTARHGVAAGAAVDRVVARAAVDIVGAGAALQIVVAVAAVDGVDAGTAQDGVVADSAVEEIDAVAAIDVVVAAAAGDQVAAGVAGQLIAEDAAGDVVVAARAGDRHQVGAGGPALEAEQAEVDISARGKHDAEGVRIAIADDRRAVERCAEIAIERQAGGAGEFHALDVEDERAAEIIVAERPDGVDVAVTGAAGAKPVDVLACGRLAGAVEERIGALDSAEHVGPGAAAQRVVQLAAHKRVGGRAPNQGIVFKITTNTHGIAGICVTRAAENHGSRDRGAVR